MKSPLPNIDVSNYVLAMFRSDSFISAPVPLALRPTIPFVGVAGAGFPSPAQDWEETRIDLVEWLAPDRASAFVMRVDGWSMRDAGIYDGDLLVVDRALMPRHGSIVVAAHEDGFIVRQLVKEATGARLEGRNAAMRTPPVMLDESVEIFGVVRACTRRLT